MDERKARADMDAQFARAINNSRGWEGSPDDLWNLWHAALDRIEELFEENNRIGSTFYQMKKDRDRYFNLCQDALGILEYQRSAQAAINILRLGLDENN